MNTEKRPRVAMLTRTVPDACYIAQHLAKSSVLELAAVVTEERTQGQKELLLLKLKRRMEREGLLSMLGLVLELPYLFWQDRRLLAAQRQAWWREMPPTFPVGVPHLAVDNLNSPVAVQQLKGIDADLLIVYGTRILKPDTFRCSRWGAVNVHMGITPEYRGAKCEFWALYRKEPELVGFTVHMIDAGIDTGGVLAQHRTEVLATDDEISLRNKNVEASIGVLERVVTAFNCGDFRTVDVSGRESCLFSTPSMWQYLALHRRLCGFRKKSG